MWRFRTLVISAAVVSLLVIAPTTASGTVVAKKKPRHKGSSTIIVTPITTTTTQPLSLTAPSAPVDLTITGTSPITVRGSAVVCFPSPIDKVRISLEDYPETGGSGFLEFSTGTPKFSGAIGLKLYYANSAVPTAIVHDGNTWTINALTAPGGGGSITISGRILCH